MASIRTLKRKDGTAAYKVRWRENGDGTETSETFDTKADAERLQDYLNANGQSYTLASEAYKQSRAHGPTLKEMIELHVKELTDVTPRTKYDYLRDARIHILPYLGGIRSGQITRTNVKEWVNQLIEEGCAPKSIHNYAGLLSGTMTTAIDHKVRKDNPCTKIKLPKKKRGDRNRVYIEPEQFPILLAQFDDYWKPLVETLSGTGGRWGEVTALTGNDVELSGKHPTVTVNKAWKRDPHGHFYIGEPKTPRAYRDVTISKDLAKMLKPLADAAGPDGYIFTTKTGKPVNYHRFQSETWKPAAARAATESETNPTPLKARLKIHGLRHSHGSWLLAAGVDIMTVSRRLGHESIKTTADIYGHVSKRADNAAAKAMGKIRH